MVESRVFRDYRDVTIYYEVSYKIESILLELQLTIKISEKTERRFGVILVPLSTKECNRKDNLYRKE